jgi:hypothetical protein
MKYLKKISENVSNEDISYYLKNCLIDLIDRYGLNGENVEKSMIISPTSDFDEISIYVYNPDQDYVESDFYECLERVKEKLWILNELEVAIEKMKIKYKFRYTISYDGEHIALTLFDIESNK